MRLFNLDFFENANYTYEKASLIHELRLAPLVDGSQYEKAEATYLAEDLQPPPHVIYLGVESRFLDLFNSPGLISDVQLKTTDAGAIYAKIIFHLDDTQFRIGVPLGSDSEIKWIRDAPFAGGIYLALRVGVEAICVICLPVDFSDTLPLLMEAERGLFPWPPDSYPRDNSSICRELSNLQRFALAGAKSPSKVLNYVSQFRFPRYPPIKGA